MTGARGRHADPDRLVEALVALGIPADEAEAAVDEDRVPLALVARMGRHGGPHTLEDVAARSGVAIDLLREHCRALGIPEHATFDDEAVEDARLLARLAEFVDPDALVRVIRADGQALTRVALSHLELAHEQFVVPLRRAGGDDVAVAIALAEAHTALKGTASEIIRHGYDRILDQLLSTELVAAATRSDEGEGVELAVGFADVVGYTSLSARIDPAGLEEVLEAFESRCYTVAGTSGPVQLVKFIGDAAMFVSTDPVALAETLCAVTAPVDEGSPLAGHPLRAALAFGPVTMRAGDYFGPPVNLAARLIDRTRAGRVLADETLAEALGERFELHRLAPVRLRDLGVHRPLALHPCGDA